MHGSLRGPRSSPDTKEEQRKSWGGSNCLHEWFGGGVMNTEHHEGKHYAFELRLQRIVFRNKVNKLLLYLRISVISSQAEEARLREVTILGFRAEMTSLLTREGQCELGLVGRSTCA